MTSKGLAHAIVSDYLHIAKELGRPPSQSEYFEKGIYSEANFKSTFSGWIQLVHAAAFKIEPKEFKRDARELILDIECSPMLVWSYGLYDQNHGVNQIYKDSYIYSWAAKWRGEKEVFYMDLRTVDLQAPVIDIKPLIRGLRDLMDEADIVTTQNGKRFDTRKLNTAFTKLKITPPSSYKQRDTKIIAKRHCDLPSYGLEYMCNYFDTPHKKLKHEKFPGMSLFTECRNGNIEAWEENRKYNINDVLCTEDLVNVFVSFDKSVNQGLFGNYKCDCGGSFLENILRPDVFTASGRYQRYTCDQCGAERRGSENLISKVDRPKIMKFSV